MKKINKFSLKTVVIFGFLLLTVLSSKAQVAISVNSQSSLVPGSTITVDVVISSPSTPILGYDVSINYDLSVLTFQSATKIFPTSANNDWFISGEGTINPNGLQFGYSNSSSILFTYPLNTIVSQITFLYHGGNTAITITDLAGGFYDDVDYLPSSSVTYTNGYANGSYATITSIGSGNWSDGTKWDLGHMPNTSNGNVIINSSAITMDQNANITGNLTINSGGALTVASGKTLAVTGNFLIKSDLSGTGSFQNDGSYTAANTTVERYLPAWPSTASTQGWHQISSPVANHALTNFTPSPATSYDFLKWDESAVEWKDQKVGANGINSFLAGTGYLVSYENAGARNFSGTLISGDVSPVISYTTPSIAPGWNFVGNPYTCAINGSINAWAKTNVNDYLYVWDDASGNYKTWNGTAGTLTGGIIPAMQAFLIKASAASPSITIPATARTHSAQNLYKSTVNDLVSLKVTSQNGMSDNAFVYFTSSATNGLDEATDAPKFYGTVQEAPQLYSLIANNKFSINAMGSLTSASVPMGFEPRINGSFTIKASEINSFNAGTVITLQDLKTGTFQNLYQNDTYTFTANANDNVNRFVLHFNTAVGVDNNNQVASKIYSNGSEIYVSSTESIKQISIYNTVGQLIYTANNPQGLFTYNLKDNSTGYYIVKVITDKNVNSEKVFVK